MSTVASLAGPASLEQLHRQHQELLQQRLALLSTLREPVGRAQARLARTAQIGVRGDARARITPHDPGQMLQQVGAAVDGGLSAAAQLEQEIGQHEARIGTLEQELGSLWYRFLDWLTAAKGATRREQLEAARAEQIRLKKAREQVLEALGREAGRLRAYLQVFCQNRLQELNDNADRIAEQLASWPAAAWAPWSADEWEAWPHAPESGDGPWAPLLSPLLRIAELTEGPREVLSSVVDGEALQQLAGGLRPISIPAFAPFIGAGKTIVVVCDQATESMGLSLIQSLILRTAALLGRQAAFTLLDPSGHGQAFPMQRFLRARKSAGDVNSDLREVVQDIRRINQEVLAGESSLDRLDRRRLASESFEFIVAANFPKGYDRQAIETLLNISESGPRAGRYVLLHYQRDQPLPREMSLQQMLPNRVLLDAAGFNQAPAGFACRYDSLPGTAFWQKLTEKVQNAGRIDHSLAWEDLVSLPPEKWWQRTSETCVETPIGLRGGSDSAEIWFGVKQDRTCAHGMLAAMTGAGKSTLYHVLILGLAVRYSPQELRMYLIDGKFGAEFRPYEQLPHAAVVSLNSPPELSRSVLEELYREMERRNNLFREAGVEDFSRYRRLPRPLHRILLLIDEYHQLFDDDRDGQASDLVRRLATQGRSSGIHLFLGSQRFGAPGMLHQKDVFGNIHLKIGMKMQPEDIVGLTEFGPVGKRMIRDCDMAGKFVLNVTGRDEESVGGKAAWLEPERRNQLIAQLREKTGVSLPPPVVFKGEQSPDVFQNVGVFTALQRRSTLTPRERETMARQEEGPARGFGQPSWVAADRPIGLWLGRLFNVHGHAMAVLRRGPSQNLVLLGAPAEARAGMLAGMLVSITALYRPDELAISVFHAGGDEEDPTVKVLRQLVDGLLLPACFEATLERNPNRIQPLLDQLTADLERRQAQGPGNLPSRLVLLIEPERMTPLRRIGDGLARQANPCYDKLRRLLADGPQHGIHLALAAPALRLLAQVLDERRDLNFFNHRVALQMSEDDSFTLFRSRKAAQLQIEGSSLPCALYANVETNQTSRCKPYSAALDLKRVDRIAQHLKKNAGPAAARAN
jgi:S-DNA-T family DNA segregation ATPase FtsK/SpoIIIE